MMIAHNILSMNAQRQWNIVGGSQKKSTEKLSSGYRVNRASDDVDTRLLNIHKISVLTESEATDTMDQVASAVDQLNKMRSKLGAQQNRLEHTIANESNIVENTQASESHVRDLDMAKEMVEHSKNNILEQAGFAMLSQANQTGQGVLVILRL